MKGIYLLLACICAALTVGAETYYVSPSGSLKEAVSGLKGGDTLYLREGRYRETLKLERKQASLENPITIMSAPGEQAVLDGTVDIASIADGEWQKHNGSIYKLEIREDIWQLIIDDQDMIRARWPNASLDPKANNYIWGGRGMTSHASPELGTGYGKILDSKLKEFPYSLDGAMVVINQRFRTWSRFVNGHEPKGDTFTHDRDVDQRHLPVEQRNPNKVPTETSHFTEKSCLYMRYYVEGKLELLDAPGEWFYDKTSGMLYVHTPAGKSPAGMTVRGKVRDYGLDVADSKGVIIDGIDFYGCTFKLEKVSECEIRNCNLKHYAALRRMLGEEVPHILGHKSEGFLPTQIVAGAAGAELKDGKIVPLGKDSDSRIAVRNCTFSHGEGTALWLKANQCVVENCLFTHCDWSCSGHGGVLKGDGYRKKFQRLEFEWCPRSETMQPNTSCLVDLCDFGQQLGLGQEDGANIEASQHFGLEIQRCWFHDNTKFGPRFDGNSMTPERHGGKMHHNVCFNMNSINPDSKVKKGAETMKLKGDAHWAVNNTLLNITGVGIGVPAQFPDGPRSPEFWKIYEQEGNTIEKFNTETVTRNNICRLIASGREVADAEAGKLPPAGIVDHNILEDAAQYLRDPANRDFRPKAKSKLVGAGVYVEGITPPELKGKLVDIGAYESGCTNYWIPGFQQARASKPIPADGATNAKPDTDLIWLGGYQGMAYDVYLGGKRKAVENANMDSPIYLGRQENNIFTPKSMPVGITAYWRIDTIKDGETVKGKVWEFKCAGSR